MTKSHSNSQFDRLGDRLREGTWNEQDLVLLDEYRRSFDGAYDMVFNAVSRVLRERCPWVEISGRRAKTKDSIIEKLRRESIRLIQMQDIAGFRVVVPDIGAQDQVVALLLHSCTGACENSSSRNQKIGDDTKTSLDVIFRDATLFDRRVKPSHGYRAVHIIARIEGKPVEIQIRSWPQHLWAELSEKYADVFDPSIKYGGGNEAIRGFLAQASHAVDSLENVEKRFDKIESEARSIRLLFSEFRTSAPKEAAELEAQISYLEQTIQQLLKEKKNIIVDMEEIMAAALQLAQRKPQ